MILGDLVVDDSITPALGGVLVAIITGVVAWLVARRTTSGSIRTSEATILWNEAQEVRKELREENRVLKVRVKALEDENESKTDRIKALEHEVAELRKQRERRR